MNQFLIPDEDGNGMSAADLIRKKVAASYTNAPSAGEEALDVAELGSGLKRSKHQQFMYQLTTSGKALADIQREWQEYYAGLTDAEKHQVWNEFYAAHDKSGKYVTGGDTAHLKQAEEMKVVNEPPVINNTSPTVRKKPKSQLKPAQHFQSLLFGLGVGAIVVIIFLFSFFNERFIAPFIQPSRTVTSTPVIVSGSSVGQASEVIIPKINVEIPVVYGVNSSSEEAIQKALEGGVVHYTNTALPGTNGNVAIVGHSSNNIFNKGKYKFAFVLLSRMEVGDTFYLQKDGKRYTYQVYDKKIVKPTETSVLAPTEKPAVATLITCDPPGTSTNRLVVVGKQISPDPSSNIAATTPATVATTPQVISGNSPTLWSRFWGWFAN